MTEQAKIETRRGSLADDLHPLTLSVSGLRAVAEGVLEVKLVAQDGGPLPLWEPGAHVSFALTPRMSRQYSLCGPLAERAFWKIAVLRTPQGRGGSALIHRDWRIGHVVRASLPRNHFAFDNASFYLFVAGGIGITPLLPMIERARRNRKGWRLVYGGRSLASMAYREELAAIGPRVELWPEDTTGRPDLAALTRELPENALVYACGPEGLLKALGDLALEWPRDRLRLERFSAATAPPDRTNRPFTAHLQASGRSILVGAGETLLEALTRSGISHPSACRAGTCGACQTRVLAGAVDHRDSVLTVAEHAAGEWMMVCVSRADGDEIALDL